jgi:glucose-1-phosphate cytidylyltransferase
MRVVILCGGLGTRLRDLTEVLPKPMVPIGGRPIVWHIMRHYARHGFDDFVLCLGYKKEVFIDFFLNYKAHNCDLTIKLGARPELTFHDNDVSLDSWRVTLADTGMTTQTGSRIRRAAKFLDGPRFMMTYGDGLSDVDLGALVAAHRASGKLATITAVHPASRFGEVQMDGAHVTSFYEKPQTAAGYINGGFMVFERAFVDRYIRNDEDVTLEAHALAEAAQDGQLNAHRHEGFWQCMDTARDHGVLEDLWARGAAPWRAP